MRTQNSHNTQNINILIVGSSWEDRNKLISNIFGFSILDSIDEGYGFQSWWKDFEIESNYVKLNIIWAPDLKDNQEKILCKLKNVDGWIFMHNTNDSSSIESTNTFI